MPRLGTGTGTAMMGNPRFRPLSSGHSVHSNLRLFQGEKNFIKIPTWNADNVDVNELNNLSKNQLGGIPSFFTLFYL